MISVETHHQEAIYEGSQNQIVNFLQEKVNSKCLGSVSINIFVIQNFKKFPSSTLKIMLGGSSGKGGGNCSLPHLFCKNVKFMGTASG